MPRRSALIPVCLVLLWGGVAAGLPNLAHSETRLEIADADGLATALKTAGAGSVLVLAGGDYGALAVKGLTGAAGEPVVLRSADPANPARFSRMELRDARHLELDGLMFDYTFEPGDKLYLRPFQVIGGQDILIRKAVFDGDRARGVSVADNGFGSAFGLSIRGSADLRLEDSEIRDFFRGLVVSQSADLTIRGNDLHTIRMDGMNFSQVQKVMIEDNHIHDFNRSLNSADHADMIQFWTNGTEVASSDITIRNNVLNSGRGLYTQSIFMRNDLVDRGLAGAEMFYRNITIEDNVIINAHLHGISVGETVGLNIRNNTVIRNAASEGEADNPSLWTPQIRVAKTSTDVRIRDNVVSAVAGYDGQADWVVGDNFLIQDRSPARPGYYDMVFVAARTGNPETLAPFAYLRGGPLDGTGIGAPRLASPASPAELNPQIRVLGDMTWLNRFSFDASLSAGPEGPLGPDARFDWDFGDGTKASGPIVTHSYAGSGARKITLTLTAADGTSRTVETTVVVPGPDVLSFDAEKGEFTAWAAGVPSLVPDTPVAIGPAVLGQGQAVIEISRDSLVPFFEARDFDLRLRVRAVGRKPAGELLRIHTTLLLSVSERGALEMRLDTATASQLRLSTPPLRLHAGGWHDIRITYSSGTERAQIEIDGKVQAQGRSSGMLKPMQHWGLALGNPFDNRKSFDGELESLHLQANIEAFAPAG